MDTTGNVAGSMGDEISNLVHNIVFRNVEEAFNRATVSIQEPQVKI